MATRMRMRMVYVMQAGGRAEDFAPRLCCYDDPADGPFAVLHAGPFAVHSDAAGLVRLRDAIDAFLQGEDGRRLLAVEAGGPASV